MNLIVSEESAPTMIGPARGEMYLEMRTPTGKRRIRMEFQLVAASWMIAFTDEVE